MAQKPILRARVDPETLARIQAIMDKHNEGVEVGAPTWDQGDVIRLLLARSLPGLEAEKGIESPAPPAKPAKKTAAKRAK